MLSPKPKIALVYDRVNTPYGGAENVLQILHELYPDAPLFTSVYDRKRAAWARNFTVTPSFLQKIPGAKNRHQFFAPLMPLAFESFSFSQFDVIISITSAEAKGILTKPNQLHICYLLTPTRYLYSHKQDTLLSRKFFSNSFGRWFASQLLNYLHWWDQAAIHRPDVIIPISERVAQRAKQYYGLSVEKALYPPVETFAKKANNSHQNYYLLVSRLVYYKHIDLAIQACQKLGEKLIVVGNGPEFSHLKKMVVDHKNIVFKKSVSQDNLDYLYQNCKALLMPGEEDFGIVALEANAYGKPTIINAKSGAAELIQDSVHGVYITPASVQGIIRALKKFELLHFKTQNLIQNAHKYDTNIFKENFKNRIEEEIIKKRNQV